MKKSVVCLCVLALVFASCASNQAGGVPESGGGAASGGAARSAGAAGNSQIPVETRIKVLFADGSLDEYVTSEYDSALTHVENQKRFSASEALLEQTEFAYQEEKGWLTTRITRDVESKLKNRVVFQYNDQDNLWKETLMNKSGKAVSSSEYEYDANGNRTKRIVYSGANIKMAETVYTLDSKGQTLSSETIDGSGKKISSTQNKYDSSGNLISQTILNASGQVSAVTNYVWQDNREISSEQLGANGSPQVRVSNEYGASGELLKRTVENIAGGSIQIFEYEYAFKPARR